MDPKLDLKTILDLHRKWNCGEVGGSRANLNRMTLETRSRFLLWFILGGLAALTLALLPDALDALKTVLF